MTMTVVHAGANEVLSSQRSKMAQHRHFTIILAAALLRWSFGFLVSVGYASEFEEFSYNYADELTFSGWLRLRFPHVYPSEPDSASATSAPQFMVLILVSLHCVVSTKLDEFNGYAASIDRFSVWGSGYNSSPNLR